MRSYLPALILLCLFASCTPYQYLTIQGIDIPKQEKNGFVFENDTLKVQYTFSGYRGRLALNIQNKTSQLLEIDWKKSSLILNGEAISLYNPGAAFSGTINIDSSNLLTRLVSPGSPDFTSNMTGSIKIDAPSQFIPPAAFVSKVPLALPLNMFQNLPEGEARHERFQREIEWQVSYRRIAFDQQASPVKLKVFLTFRNNAGTGQNEFSVVHSFFVSEIWKTNANPKAFPDSVLTTGNIFFL